MNIPYHSMPLLEAYALLDGIPPIQIAYIHPSAYWSQHEWTIHKRKQRRWKKSDQLNHRYPIRRPKVRK